MSANLMTPREERFYRDMETRTKRDMRVVHVLHEAGSYFCLDLSLQASTLPQLQVNIVAFLTGYADDSILPAAPREEWEKLAGVVHGEIERERWTMDSQTTGTRPMLWFVVVEK